LTQRLAASGRRDAVILLVAANPDHHLEPKSAKPNRANLKEIAE